MASLGEGNAAVKPRRRYDASGRRRRAEAARQRVVEAAERAFLRDGYAAPTIAAIAEEAGVSVDTLYKTFGGKPGLLKAVYEAALRGNQAVPAEERSDRLQASERDPRVLVRAWGRFVAELAPRGTPIALLLRSAAMADPELRALVDELDGSRLRRMTENARRLAEAGHLRPGVSLARAADVLWTYSSPELYELLVLRRGMTPDEYGEFVGEAMVAALL